ncbi:CLUMA_CG014087, isoform A [Clunio marinus]|uniref:Probable RNA-binding protein EIF1AD n=1 Tax=Clunio marinus TaxID=568069 RepID=A0A1J1IKT4_9DIPT|nr:CLUMA_CG014087, isoform A [Clunio marinus]
MSRVVKLKHVKREIELDDFSQPTDNQEIVKIISSKGNNLHEVESALGMNKFLVSMPTKFRKNVWIKRGNFVIVERIPEGDKVKAEIVRILTDEHIKEFTKDGIWPKEFTKKRCHEESDDDLDNFKGNLNRKTLDVSEEESSSSESE